MPIEFLGLLVAGAGASWGLWQLQRHRFSRGRRQLEAALEDDANIVFTVAGHAATSRGHQEMWPLHLLYGLLQDDTFTQAVRVRGGDPDAIETKVLAELDSRKSDEASARELVQLLNHAFGVAHASDRKVSVIDLAVTLLHLDVRDLLGVDAHPLRHQLVHGMQLPEPELAGRTDVAVVLRNDNYTTFEFVIGILENVFELSPADAEARARETHAEGRCVIGRYKTNVARDKIITVRSRAREQGFPLWIGVEDI